LTEEGSLRVLVKAAGAEQLMVEGAKVMLPPELLLLRKK
jgi:hypothetical protein